MAITVALARFILIVSEHFSRVVQLLRSCWRFPSSPPVFVCVSYFLAFVGQKSAFTPMQNIASRNPNGIHWHGSITAYSITILFLLVLLQCQTHLLSTTSFTIRKSQFPRYGRVDASVFAPIYLLLTAALSLSSPSTYLTLFSIKLN